MSEPLIKIEHLKKVYPNITPIEDLNAEIYRGDVISIIGPSGTGKSTFLRCMNRLEEPSGGRIIVDGEDICASGVNISLIRRKMGMVFQSFNLFDNLNIIENLMAAPVKLLKMSRQEAYDKGMELLRRVGLAQKALNFPDELSGGQKQRAAIARAVAMKPEILLFDEPTSALDPTMVGEVLSVIRSLAKEHMTMMIVTHEMKFAHDVSNRVFFMEERGIYEEGTPQQIFSDPKKEKTRAFIKRLKVLDLVIENKDFDLAGTFTEIEKFGLDNLINRKSISDLELCFEEMIVNQLMKMDAVFPISVTIEYSEQESSSLMNVKYEGSSFSPFTDGDELSARIVKRISKSFEHKYLGGVNIVDIKFR